MIFMAFARKDGISITTSPKVKKARGFSLAEKYHAVIEVSSNFTSE